MRKTILFSITAGLLWGGVAVGATDEVAEVEKKLSDMVGRYKTIAYKMKTTSDVKTPEMTMKMDSQGAFEAARRGDSWVSRMEAETRTLQKDKEGKEQKDEGKILQVYDGQYSWTYSEGQGQKTAMKMKADPKMVVSPFDVKAMFEMLRREFNLRLLPEEKIDGKAVWVIEATPKKANSEEMGDIGKSLSYYRKDTGIVTKGVTFDRSGKPVSTTTFTDVRTNAEFPPERFVFKAPPGVEVMDMTAMGEPSQEEEAPAQAREPARQEPAPSSEAKTPAESGGSKPKQSKGVKGLLDKLK